MPDPDIHPNPFSNPPTVEETVRRLLDIATQMGGVEKGLTEQGGKIVISHHARQSGDELQVSARESDPWVVGIEFGQEAPDSDMAGGAAYGMGDTMIEALQKAVDETGWLRHG